MVKFTLKPYNRGLYQFLYLCFNFKNVIFPLGRPIYPFGLNTMETVNLPLHSSIPSFLCYTTCGKTSTADKSICAFAQNTTVRNRNRTAV